ncbi:MAG: CDP-alcohol phosphatidyltransferase family protein [Nocardioides sp.]|uniref:CDP-alcohol phosphatidyltransferase family protein n=1 Tax=Nocardioides sp. TaxID=35761 RepID=UPI003D6C4E76
MTVAVTAPLPVLRERLVSVPNTVTVLRTVLALALGIGAVAVDSLALLGVAYVCYWAGDSLDGYLARKLDQETKVGAVFDCVCDRASTCILAVGLIAHAPEVWPPVAVFLANFMVLDMMLSLSFLCWPHVVSPNYFYLIDERVFRLNWSHPAKAANTAGVVLMVVLGLTWPVFLWVALVAALAIFGVKIWSTVRVARLLALG